MIEYPLGEDRQTVMPSAFARAGVVDRDSGALRVTRGDNSTVVVAAGRCVIDGGERLSGPGMYLCTSTAAETVDVAPDTVVFAQVHDKRDGATDRSTWIITSAVEMPTDAIALAHIDSNGTVVDARRHASSGSADIVGTFGATGIDSRYYQAPDASRPLTWSKNREGWVTLGGWLRRVGTSAELKNGVFYSFDGRGQRARPVLPPEIRPTGIRDVCGLSSNGDYHVAI
ncbi:hypothetical protein [Pseudonocardia sp. ICBG1142]|uniref:hypothetical protein n=1 Tax=Pseudonocardia sp. ICBG1142 TaxID=2846760 RepID=UPI001CF6D83C|nr:hypothetical protein [Pseudonocardia sp. ICBG1142]